VRRMASLDSSKVRSRRWAGERWPALVAKALHAAVASRVRPGCCFCSPIGWLLRFAMVSIVSASLSCTGAMVWVKRDRLRLRG